MSFNFFQMALWLRSNNKLYIPPTPVARILSTDDYITRTNVYYHANSERLLTVGHPYYEQRSSDGNTITIPKVSANQFRVFRILLPDPNKFAFPDPSFYNFERERLVWAVLGIEVGRGQPLGVGLSGNPLFNKYEDTENPSTYVTDLADDQRLNMSFDVKQTQTFILGCVPAKGEHWTAGTPCEETPVAAGDCPPLELVDSIIEDGDMVDIGFGAMDFRILQQTKSDVPLDISNSVCKYPDYIQMNGDPYGDSLFFFARREQMYARHFMNRAGEEGEAVPPSLIFKPKSGDPRETLGNVDYFATPSGSLVSSDAQIFNRPYWIQRTQGKNNGICWANQLFLTIVDNTRGTNLSISRSHTTSATEYTASNFRQFLRHVEEFEISIIVQLCKVPLSTDVLSHIYAMNPAILEDWNLGVNIPSSLSIEDKYRYIKSFATPCPDTQPAKEPVDPFAKYNFWLLDFQERMSADLDQYSLGRKFIYQSGLFTSPADLTTPRTVASKRKRRVRTVGK
ncbi:L1 [Morelia spilota papillomavirus 1]|uniref:Major capsid protein L1 n=1 Tax=Morelia spilota papillomavirus 1 TaxID=1081054 RepID=G3DRD6_9PAPI|nr:L1 [Morelia spilota papillomavirus 1]AEO16190.1 L1 [Morelia spilota papillomavirus 1]